MPSGNISIRPIRGELCRNTEKFGRRMDPYVRITIGGNSQQTSVSHNTHKTPSWGDTLGMRINNEDIINVEVWDYDHVTRNDLIGSGTVSVNAIMQRGNKFREWVPLHYKGGKAGQVLLDIMFVPDGGAYGMAPTTVGYQKVMPMQQTYPQQTMTMQQAYPQQMMMPQQTMMQPTYPQQMTYAQPVQPIQPMQPVQQVYPQQQGLVQPMMPQQTYAQPMQQMGYVQPMQQVYPQQQQVMQPMMQQGYPQQMGGYVAGPGPRYY